MLSNAGILGAYVVANIQYPFRNSLLKDFSSALEKFQIIERALEQEVFLSTILRTKDNTRYTDGAFNIQGLSTTDENVNVAILLSPPADWLSLKIFCNAEKASLPLSIKRPEHEKLSPFVESIVDYTKTSLPNLSSTFGQEGESAPSTGPSRRLHLIRPGAADMLTSENPNVLTFKSKNALTILALAYTMTKITKVNRTNNHVTFETDRLVFRDLSQIVNAHQIAFSIIRRTPPSAPTL